MKKIFIKKLLPKKFQYHRLEDIFEQGFRYWKFFSFRMEFKLIDYVHHHISHEYRTFKRPLLITTNSWICILYLIALTINCRQLISLKYIEQMISSNGFNLVIIDILIGCLFVEWMWFNLFNNVLHYRCSLVDFLAHNLHIEQDNLVEKLQPKHKRFLINLYTITNIMANCFYLMVIMALIIVFIIYSYYSIILLMNNYINILQLILSIPLTAMLMIYLSCMLGQIFLSINFLVLLIEFCRIRMKRLYNLSKIIESNNQRSIRFSRSLWKRFVNDYCELFHDISRLNQTVRITLFNLEMISKSSIMTAFVFYIQQTDMKIANITIILALISAFTYTTCLYSRVSIIPSYNQCCVRLFYNLFARLQCSNQMTKSNNEISNKNYRHTIRKNLFLQTMSINRFGFSCGQIFFITRFKYIQLLMMNFPLVLKFYKKNLSYKI